MIGYDRTVVFSRTKVVKLNKVYKKVLSQALEETWSNWNDKAVKYLIITGEYSYVTK